MLSRTICAAIGLLLFSGCSTGQPQPLITANHAASPEAIEATPALRSTTLAVDDPVLAANTPPASTKTTPMKPDASMKDMPGMKHGGHP